MPVTAKLSKRFYDQFGEDIVNEMVDWFNAVDARSRDDLRQLNELNFARFDAKLEQRLAELRTDLRAEMASGFGELRAEMALLRKEIHDASANLLKWSFVFWVGAVGAIAALAGVLH